MLQHLPGLDLCIEHQYPLPHSKCKTCTQELIFNSKYEVLVEQVETQLTLQLHKCIWTLMINKGIILNGQKQGNVEFSLQHFKRQKMLL